MMDCGDFRDFSSEPYWVAFTSTIVYFIFISRRHAGKVSVKRDTRDFTSGI